MSILKKREKSHREHRLYKWKKDIGRSTCTKKTTGPGLEFYYQ